MRKLVRADPNKTEISQMKSDLLAGKLNYTEKRGTGTAQFTAASVCIRRFLSNLAKKFHR
jgi:hypothetical protein